MVVEILVVVVSAGEIVQGDIGRSTGVGAAAGKVNGEYTRTLGEESTTPKRPEIRGGKGEVLQGIGGRKAVASDEVAR